MAAQRSSPVRNSAPCVKSGAEITLAGSFVSDAARFSRSRSARSSRTNLRSPVTSLVPAQKSQANPCHPSRVRFDRNIDHPVAGAFRSPDAVFPLLSRKVFGSSLRVIGARL